MYTEIERKFLVLGDAWRPLASSVHFCQGYIYSSPQSFVRVRTENDGAVLTIKGPKSGIGRPEFEYAIPFEDAEELLEHLAHKPLIYKTRHNITLGKHTWEVDEFRGDNAGLIVAEIELQSEEEIFEKPPWIGEEVTFDPRYRNAALARHPYCMWDDAQKNR